MTPHDQPIDLDQIRQKKSQLEQRLEDGYLRIGEAELQGTDISNWEQFWFSLLGEYESVCDELLAAA
jgi:hypothetical protein